MLNKPEQDSSHKPKGLPEKDRRAVIDALMLLSGIKKKLEALLNR
jgi:predicted flap endonuclease-1-like 5' DNA nuclease